MVTKKPKASKIKCCSLNFEEKGCGGFGYFMGFIGAAIYYVSQSTGILGGVLGVVKGIFWPAFLVHGLLKFIGA